MQPDLFEEYRICPVEDGALTIEERFRLFHARNPWVYTELVRLLEEKRQRGYRIYSMKGLYEELRFMGTIRADGDPYALNNDYTALYARKIREESPILGEMLRTRERRSL